MFRRVAKSGSQAILRGLGFRVEGENQSLTHKLQAAFGQPELSEDAKEKNSQERIDRLLGRKKRTFAH